MTSIYTDNMVSRLRAEAPLNFEKAKMLSQEGETTEEKEAAATESS